MYKCTYKYIIIDYFHEILIDIVTFSVCRLACSCALKKYGAYACFSHLVASSFSTGLL